MIGAITSGCVADSMGRKGVSSLLYDESLTSILCTKNQTLRDAL